MTSLAPRAGESESDAPATFDELLTSGPEERRSVFRDRVWTVLTTLGLATPDLDPKSAVSALEDSLNDPSGAWLVLAVITGFLPASADVRHLVRAARLGDAQSVLLDNLRVYKQLDCDAWPQVEVVSDRVVVDLHHTARNLFATGIQRVSREAASRWQRDHDVLLIGWTVGYGAYRRLSDQEIEVALHGGGEPVVPPSGRVIQDVVVPWRCRHVVPELPAEPERARRYQGFVTFSGCQTGLVGHDCVPLTAAETCAEGMTAGYVAYLAAAARVDRIATVSETAATEYRGWRDMLAGAGLGGPDIEPVPNAVQARLVTDVDINQAKELIGIGSLPVVLAVGSHEPRKNQLPILYAAEVLWREGLQYTLTFVGGNSWNSAGFNARARELQRRQRPLQIIQALSDDLLWAAYRVAYCTVFPSLHEGFGLPVAESLACGTPVITSNYGATRECAGRGGALLVDPRDDLSLTSALRQILTDRPLRDRLAAEAAAIPARTWDDYAAETWEYLVEGRAPSRLG